MVVIDCGGLERLDGSGSGCKEECIEDAIVDGWLAFISSGGSGLVVLEKDISWLLVLTSGGSDVGVGAELEVIIARYEDVVDLLSSSGGGRPEVRELRRLPSGLMWLMVV